MFCDWQMAICQVTFNVNLCLLNLLLYSVFVAINRRQSHCNDCDIVLMHQAQSKTIFMFYVAVNEKDKNRRIMKDSSHRTCINIGCDTITQSHLMPLRKSNDWDLYAVKESSAPDSLLTLQRIRQNENQLINDHLFSGEMHLFPVLWLYSAKRPYLDLSSI